MTLECGRQIGPYVLVRELGRGGFGVVWHAKSPDPPVDRALKFASVSVTKAQVEKEVQSWTRANGHENIAPFLGSYEHDNQVVLMSEYVVPGSLEDWLKMQGRLPLQHAVKLMVGILKGLDHLHGLRIVHRDLKPANVLLNGDQPLLNDFGLARLLDTDENSHVTWGSLPYMSPEAIDEDRDLSVDLWAAGVVLYELISGELPFGGDTRKERIHSIKHDPPRPLPPETPPLLARMAYRALVKDPNGRQLETFPPPEKDDVPEDPETLRLEMNRYRPRPSAQDMYAALEGWLSEQPPAPSIDYTTTPSDATTLPIAKSTPSSDEDEP